MADRTGCVVQEKKTVLDCLATMKLSNRCPRGSSKTAENHGSADDKTQRECRKCSQKLVSEKISCRADSQLYAFLLGAQATVRDCTVRKVPLHFTPLSITTRFWFQRSPQRLRTFWYRRIDKVEAVRSLFHNCTRTGRIQWAARRVTRDEGGEDMKVGWSGP